ncbi:MAG TPA: dienelactone hydrolase family protein [Tepidisphaeraceae bacterium]|nr:dienelactone hydrolase family protein [Tepidisphaeraceae bacterium]
MTILEPQTVDVPTPTGPMRSFVFRPAAGGRYPGIVLYSEIFQVTGPIRRFAAILAGHGYVVAAPEIYHEFEPPGTALAYDPAGTERGNALKITKDLSAYDADAAAAIAMLQSRPDCTGKVGACGICIGGHLAFRAAMHKSIRAAACFYATDIHKRGLGKGTHDDSLDRIRDITGELLMIWGRQDPHIPTEGRALICKALTETGTNFTWHEFNAQHAFMRDEGLRYDPELSRICTGLVLSLFARRLGEGDERSTPGGAVETRH